MIFEDALVRARKGEAVRCVHWVPEATMIVSGNTLVFRYTGKKPGDINANDRAFCRDWFFWEWEAVQ